MKRFLMVYSVILILLVFGAFAYAGGGADESSETDWSLLISGLLNAVVIPALVLLGKALKQSYQDNYQHLSN